MNTCAIRSSRSAAFRAARFRSDGWYAQAAYYVIPNKLQLVEQARDVRSEQRRPRTTRPARPSPALNWYFKGHDLKLQLDWMRSRVPGLPSEQQKVIARLQTVF